MAGNPASILSGIACLEVLKEKGTYEKLDRLGATLEEGILTHAQTHGIDITVNRLKGALTVYFTNEKVETMSKPKIRTGDMSRPF